MELLTGLENLPLVPRLLRKIPLPVGAAVTSFSALPVGASFRFVYGEGALNARLSPNGTEGRTASEVVHQKISARRFALGLGLAVGHVFKTGGHSAVLVITPGLVNYQVTYESGGAVYETTYQTWEQTPEAAKAAWLAEFAVEDQEPRVVRL